MTISFEFESFFIFYFFILYVEIMNWLKKKLLNAKNVVIAIALNILYFKIFSIFFILHLYIYRSIKSNNNFWKYFWHNSIFYASWILNNKQHRIKYKKLFFCQWFYRKNYIYLTSNASKIDNFIYVVFIRIFCVKFSQHFF